MGFAILFSSYFSSWRNFRLGTEATDTFVDKISRTSRDGLVVHEGPHLLDHCTCLLPLFLYACKILISRFHVMEIGERHHSPRRRLQFGHHLPLDLRFYFHDPIHRRSLTRHSQHRFHGRSDIHGIYVRSNGVHESNWVYDAVILYLRPRIAANCR